ncbi:MAG: biotin--[acetyl-CoA-carboxylase] ligase [Acidimicrobiales bacterium]
MSDYPSAFIVQHLDEVPSTNSWVLAAAQRGAVEGTVAVARAQSAGRGRLGRRWLCPPGAGLLFSVLLRPRLVAQDLFCASALVALATLDACATKAPSLSLKWPNDLVVGDRKLGGILAEVSEPSSEDPAVAVGVGLNVSWPMPGQDAERLNATCLEAIARAQVDHQALLASILGGIARRRGSLEGPETRRELIGELARRTATLGRWVRIDLGHETFLGQARALDENGRLIVDVEGARRVVAAADVVHLRDRSGGGTPG